MLRMTQNKTLPRALQERGAQWLLTAQMALAFARCLLRLSEKNPRRAGEVAAMFELWLAGAASQLASQVTALGLREDAKDPHARRLYAALYCFLLLILFVQRLRGQIAAKIARLPAARWRASANATLPAPPVPAMGFIDTS